MDHEFRVKIGCQLDNDRGPVQDEQMILLMNGEDVRIQVAGQPDIVVTIDNLDLAVSHLVAVRRIVKRHEAIEGDKPAKQRVFDYLDDDGDDDDPPGLDY